MGKEKPDVVTDLVKLKDDLAKTKNDLKLLTVKLKKICAVKRKPKGCQEGVRQVVKELQTQSPDLMVRIPSD